MRVSLCVLSGSRRGEYVELDADEFCVGGEPSCDVYFRPESDAAARGVCVRLRRDDDGWRISLVSGRGSLVNQQILESTLPIRSGDIVRLSPDGPDFRFSVVTVLASDHSGSAPLSAGRQLGKDAATATASGQSPKFSLATAAMIVAAVALVLVVVALLSLPPKEPSKPVGLVDPKPPVTTPSGKPAVPAPTSAPTPSADSPPPSKPAAPSPSQPPPADKKKPLPVVQEPSPARPVEVGPTPRILPETTSPLVVLAIGSEDNKVLQPFAVACAVEQDGREMLLTTGRIARIMALFPQQYYAIVPGGAETKPTVVELKQGQIFLHRLYADNVEPEVRDAAQYFDVGILLPAGKLPLGTACRVASRAKVEGIKSGTGLRCWTAEKPRDISFAQGAIRDGQFRLQVRQQPVQLSRAILLWKENDEDRSTADRRLFELDGPPADFLEGSPLLDSEGEIVAMYSKWPAAAGEEQKQRPAAARQQQPRAALVDAEMIGALWTGKPSVMWIGYRAEKRSPPPTGGRH
jgi:hypothetical protein